MRILYMDDRPKTVEPIVKFLEKNYFVKLEINAKKARKELLKNPYDVIILDYEMIQQDYGDKILEKIRNENYNIRVIMVTAKIRVVTELAEVINHGISKCYFKTDPELLDKLKTGIDEVIQNRDSIILGLESWLEARKYRKEIIFSSGKKRYTASKLLDEIKRNSNVGKDQVQALIFLMQDLITKKKQR